MDQGMKKGYIILIISLFIVLLIPIAYYFMYALPQHNIAMQELEKEKLQQERDKLEHEKELARQEQERIEQEQWEREQERLDKQREKEEKEKNYYNCIETANEWRSDNFDKYCDLSYQTCIQSIDDWNKKALNKVSYSECDKYRIDENGNCAILDNYAKERKEGYERQLKICDRYL